MRKTLGVVYCEGWDPVLRMITGRLPVAVARERDRAGEQYAFCLVEPETGRVVRVGEIAWGARFARVWSLDELGRRERSVEYRVLGGRLFHLLTREWTYRGREKPEFAEDCDTVKISNEPDGQQRRQWQWKGGSGGGGSEWRHEGDPAEFFGDVPRFSDWAGLCAVDVDLVELDSEQEFAEPPWHPSAPLRPEGLEAAFQPGRRWTVPHWNRTVVTELADGGTVRFPTGQVVVADPALLYDVKPFTATIPPGDHRLELSILRFEDEPEHVRVVAAKLVVTREPVVSWEHAVTAEQDTLLLGDGEYYGFGVDGGQGCFVDAVACPALDEIIAESDEVIEQLCTTDGPRTAVLTEPESGATLVAFSSGMGDGAYPVWVGRGASGEVACFVADMLLLRYAEPVAEEVLPLS
jgi:hypothetical protein